MLEQRGGPARSTLSNLMNNYPYRVKPKRLTIKRLAKALRLKVETVDAAAEESTSSVSWKLDPEKLDADRQRWLDAYDQLSRDDYEEVMAVIRVKLARRR